MQYLSAHREEAKQEEDGAPNKKAHREKAGQEEEEIHSFVGWEYPKLAEHQHPHMATLIRVMKAILGYTPVKWHEGRDNLIIGGMLLEDLRIGFCLRSAKEL